MDLESVRLRVFQELAALALELGEEHLPVRGGPIPPEMDGLGEVAAREWLRTGRRPSLLAERVALFPRLWFASMFLKHAMLHRTLALSSDKPAGLLSVALLEGWQAAGKAQWEAPRKEMPWGG